MLKDFKFNSYKNSIYFIAILQATIMFALEIGIRAVIVQLWNFIVSTGLNLALFGAEKLGFIQGIILMYIFTSLLNPEAYSTTLMYYTQTIKEIIEQIKINVNALTNKENDSNDKNDETPSQKQ